MPTDAEVPVGIYASQFFKRSEVGGYSYVFQQPVSPEELALAMQALQECPTETIGNDG